MPNWCDNTLEINASKDVINAIKKKAKGKISPSTEEISEFSFLPFVEHLIPNGYDNVWYDFNLSVLGCKWFPKVSEGMIDTQEEKLVINFETAWSPSTEATKYLVKWLQKEGFEFDITHSYYEPGVAFCGILNINNNDGESEQQGETAYFEVEEILSASEEELKKWSNKFELTPEELLRKAKEAEEEGFLLFPKFFPDEF